MISSRMFEKIEKVKSLAFVIKKKLSNESYVMTPLAAQLERKLRRDRGTRRGRRSTSSSSAFDQPSLSHLNNDDDDGLPSKLDRVMTPLPAQLERKPRRDRGTRRGRRSTSSSSASHASTLPLF
ncbi:hypothetical protein Tco_1129646 [Tanacetum coccineum]